MMTTVEGKVRAGLASAIAGKDGDELEQELVKVLRLAVPILLNVAQAVNQIANPQPESKLSPSQLTAILVKQGARVAASMGSAQAAVLLSTFHGMLSTFGFAGTLKIFVAMLKQGKGKTDAGKAETADDGLPKSGVCGESGHGDGQHNLS